MGGGSTAVTVGGEARARLHGRAGFWCDGRLRGIARAAARRTNHPVAGYDYPGIASWRVSQLALRTPSMAPTVDDCDVRASASGRMRWRAQTPRAGMRGRGRSPSSRKYFVEQLPVLSSRLCVARGPFGCRISRNTPLTTGVYRSYHQCL